MKTSSPINRIDATRFATICKDSKTLAEIIRRCGLRADGNYPTVKRRIKRERIDISHIPVGAGSNRGRRVTMSMTKDTFLSRLDDPAIQMARGTIKQGLIRHGILDHTHCSICSCADTWNERALRMQLDHIDGDSTNNRLSNLRFVCPNCHSQTETFGKGTRQRRYYTCVSCGETRSCHSSPRCRRCSHKHSHPTKIAWPSDEDLGRLVWAKPRTVLSKELGVSAEAIGKRCRARGISQPGRGHWAKVQTPP